MNLKSRIQRAETQAFGAGLNIARVLAMAERGEYDRMTDAELTWLMAGMRQELAPETNAEIDRLFESFSDADLDAICESRELSPEGNKIKARIYELLGDDVRTYTA
jgi:hypothetical protein